MLGDSRTRNTGKNYGSEHLFDFNSRSGYETVSDGPFLAKSIHVNVDRLHDTADLHDINLSGMGKIDYAMPRLVDPTKIQQLQDTIRNMEYLVSPMDYQRQKKDITGAVEDEVYRKLAECLDFYPRDEPVSQLNRLTILRRSIDYIQSHYNEMITITEICRDCATTSRTLERVFREEFGITPKQYLTKIRLSKARQALCRKNQEMSITDIAISSGFSHMSKFALDYKNYFGELPSQSLQWDHIAPNPFGVSQK